MHNLKKIWDIQMSIRCTCDRCSTKFYERKWNANQRIRKYLISNGWFSNWFKRFD